MAWIRFGCAAASRSTISPVPSGELSSTTSTSKSAAWPRTALTMASMFSRSLYVGSTTSDLDTAALTTAMSLSIDYCLDVLGHARVPRSPAHNGGHADSHPLWHLHRRNRRRS